MISKLLNILESGAKVMRANNRLLFVAALIFIFPVLFIYITQGFYETAYDNIQTAEKRRVGIFQDGLDALLETTGRVDGATQKAISATVGQNPDITEVRIVERTPEGLIVRFSLNSEDIGTFEPNKEFYDRAALVAEGNSYITEFTLDETRMWQAIRSVESVDGTHHFILSEHSFAKLDSTMQKRRQQSYFGLTAIFIFLMSLAYWIAKQTEWRNKSYALQQQLEERDLFTNMIAHEFRTPLTAINGYTSFLAESKNTSPDEKHYVETIQVSTARLLALVNDFLEVARIQSGRLALELEPTDVREVLSGVVDALQTLAKEKGLSLTLAESSTAVTRNTDKKRLHQVIQNLVSNALKYTEKGSVEIVCEDTPLATTIRIKDTGMGISAEDQKKLFAPFSRVGGVEKTNITGTGLGMWITKQLVEILGGTIEIESIKNVGTHVVITFKR